MYWNCHSKNPLKNAWQLTEVVEGNADEFERLVVGGGGADVLNHIGAAPNADGNDILRTIIDE